MDNAKTVLDSLSAAALLWETAGGRVSHVNRRCAALLDGADTGSLTLMPDKSADDLFGGGRFRFAACDVILADDAGFLMPFSGHMYRPDGAEGAYVVFIPEHEVSEATRRALNRIGGMPAAPSDTVAAVQDAASVSSAALSAIESMPGKVFVKDLEKRYVGCSQAFADFLGLESPACVTGKTAFDLLPRESAEWDDRLDDMLLGRLQPLSEVHPFSIRPGEPASWQRVSRSPLYDGGGELTGLVGMMEGENSLHTLAEELTMAKARFRAVSDVMSYNAFILALWNVDDLSAEYISDTVAALGFKPGGFSSLDDWAAIVHPDDLEEYSRAIKPLREKHLNVDFWHEYRVTDVGGITRGIRERVSSVLSPGAHLYRSVMVDVTARRGYGADTLHEDGAQRPVHLLDLLSRDILQQHCDRVSEALGMSSFILDAAGSPLTDKHGKCELCDLLNGTSRGAALCRMSEENLCIAAREAAGGGAGIIVQPCESLGLYMAAAPIMMDSMHMGTWVVGRVRVRGAVNQDNLRALFSRLGGADGDGALGDTAIEAFERMREWETADVKSVFDKLTPYVKELSELALGKYMLMYRTDRIVKPRLGDADAEDAALICGALFGGHAGIHASTFDDALSEIARVLCSRFNLKRMMVVERAGRGFGVTFESGGGKPAGALDLPSVTVSDLRMFVPRRPGAAVQLPAASGPNPWRAALNRDGSGWVMGVARHNGGPDVPPGETRPNVAVLFTAASQRGELTAAELRSLDSLLAPVVAAVTSRRSERSLTQGADALKMIMNNLRSAVYVIDRANLEVLFSNDGLDGRMSDEPRGISCFRLRGQEGICSGCALGAMDGMPEGTTYAYETDEREPGCWHYVSITGVTWTGGRPAYLIRARDITEEKLQRDRMMHAVTFDMLLNVPTIGRLSARLDELMKGCGSGYLFLIDVDNVRGIMNSYGHGYSDALLKEVVYYLKDTAGDGNVYRYASETLAVLLEGARRDFSLAFAEKLYARFGKQWRILDKVCYSTFSAGMAPYRPDMTVPDVIRNADMTLSRAIDRMRNSFYEEAGDDSSARAARLALAGDLHAMVEAGCEQMTISYQPIYDLNEGRVTHCEAFMRWQHPRIGLIPPLDFLDIAEYTSLIIPLSEAMMRTAAAQCREWLDAGLDVGVSINFSAAHSRTDGVFDAIREAINDSRLPPGKLQFEIAEDLTINDREHALNFIEGLREMGCLVAIDNFATGLSALSTIGATPVDVIKIDRDFVGDACDNEYHAAVVEFAAKTARICGMQLTCKGIETVEQLEKIRELGADHVQGFLLSRPLPAAEATELLKKDPKL